MPRQRWCWWWGGAGIALALVAAACGAGMPSGPVPIRVGALSAIDTLGSAGLISALRAAARDVNREGGVRGRPLEIEYCDDGNDPNRAQVCARQLVRDGVIATAGNLTNLGMVEAPILDAAGIPQVGTTALSREESSLPSSFPLDGGAPGVIAATVVAMQRRGLRSLYVVVPDQPDGRTVDQLASADARGAGVDVVGVTYIPAAAGSLPPTEVSPYVQAAIQSRAAVVYTGLPRPLLLQFLQGSRRAHARYAVAFHYGELLPADIRALGGALSATEGGIEFSGLPPLTAAESFPALAKFQSDLDVELRSGDRAADRDRRSGASLVGWLAVQVLARVAASLPDITAASVLRELKTSTTIDTLGLTPPWAPGRAGPSLSPRATNPFGYLIVQRNGVEVLAAPTPFDPFLALGPVSGAPA